MNTAECSLVIIHRIGEVRLPVQFLSSSVHVSSAGLGAGVLFILVLVQVLVIV